MILKDPQSINKKAWYYEDKSGIEIYYEVRTLKGEYLYTDHFKIPRRKIKRSLLRMEA